MTSDANNSTGTSKLKNITIPSILGAIIIVSVVASISLYSLESEGHTSTIKESADALKQDVSAKSFYVNQLASQHLSSIEKTISIMTNAKSFQTGEYDRIKLLLDAAKSDSSEIVDAFFIVDKDGQLRYTTNTDTAALEQVGTSFSSHVTYVQTKQTMKSFISSLTPSTLYDKNVFFVASPIVDQQTGEFSGTVAAVIYADTFAKNIEKLVVVNAADAQSSSFSLLDAEGKIMYAGPSARNLGQHILSEEVLGAIPSPIKESFVASLEEALSGKSGIYEINLAEHPELNTNSTANANALDYVLLSYAPVEVEGQIVMISFVIKSASLQKILAEETTISSQIYLFIYSMLGTMTAFAVAIIVINRKLSRTVETKTKELLKTNEDLRHMAAEITEQEKKLREADIEKEEFSAMITHELKTPLVPVIGYSELLLDGTLGALSEKQRETVQVMNSSAVSLSRLISDLLDARKLALGKMKFEMRHVSPEELVKNCIRVLEPLARAKHVTLVPRMNSKESDGLSVTCDPKRINQVLGNLVDNGIKFVSADTGKVEISVSKKENSGDIIFSIKDNGVGIPKDKQQNIFKKFYQADTSMTRNAGGTGLGLAICKAIIDAHDGKIWFESETGVGTTFSFSLPPSLKPPTTLQLEGIN